MKLVTEFYDSTEAGATSDRLREAGVMTTVTGAEPHRLSQSRTGVIKVGLWVVFDDQHDDARRLLANPGHRPKRILTIEEMDEIESEAKTRQLKFGSKLFRNGATLVLGMSLVALILYVIIGMINEAWCQV